MWTFIIAGALILLVGGGIVALAIWCMGYFLGDTFADIWDGYKE